MKNKIRSFRQLFLAIVCLFFISRSFANVTTYGWPAYLKHKGFSIEQIPGVVPAQYVAAGTVYHTNGNQGLHFMRLDQNGNILADRVTYPVPVPGETEMYHVVDIAVENANRFWITTSFRSNSPSILNSYKDMVIWNLVDGNGNDLLTSSYEGVSSTISVMSHPNLYPTHSIFHNGYLYICGYAAEQKTRLPGSPDAHSNSKLGFIYKIQPVYSGPNLNTNIVASYKWSTTGTSTSTDYDMPLRMYVNANANIILTGACNSNDPTYIGSSVLAMELDATTVWPINQRTITPNVSVSPGNPDGWYGVDISEDASGYFLLCNYFVGTDTKTWGVLHIDANLMANTTVQSMMVLSPGLTSNAYMANMFLDGGKTVAGQLTGLQCSGTVPAPHTMPGILNIDPFLHFGTWSFNGLSGISKTFSGHKIQLSVNGTSGAYLASSVLEDYARLYTSFVKDVNTGDYAMISPVKNISGSNLVAKFIHTNPGGNETQCNSTYTDCNPFFARHYITDEANFVLWGLDDIERGEQSADDNDMLYSVYNCSSRNYRTTSPAAMGIETKASLSVYPNPAYEKVNVVLVGTEARQDVTVHMYNSIGQVVHTTNKLAYGNSEYRTTINTAGMPSGLYMLSIHYNGKTFTKQVAVQ